MLRKFIVNYIGGKYGEPLHEAKELEDSESVICGYVSWALLNSPALSILLIRSEKDGGKVVAVAEKKVLVTLKQHGAADITKLI